jgi:hypothetical protein
MKVIAGMSPLSQSNRSQIILGGNHTNLKAVILSLFSIFMITLFFSFVPVNRLVDFGKQIWSVVILHLREFLVFFHGLWFSMKAVLRARLIQILRDLADT